MREAKIDTNFYRNWGLQEVVMVDLRDRYYAYHPEDEFYVVVQLRVAHSQGRKPTITDLNR